MQSISKSFWHVQLQKSPGTVVAYKSSSKPCLFSASQVVSNLTAKTAAKARNNATWHLLLDEDSTKKTFLFGKITRDLSNFFLRAIH